MSWYLREVALQVLDENKQKFLAVKGSDWQHRNYAGGLIVHICNVTLNAIRMVEFYGDLVCLDLVKFCALMHDVGKLFDYTKQSGFTNDNNISINQALLGHSFEGAFYVMNKLQKLIQIELFDVPRDYVAHVISQVTHCIGAHMDDFGACAKQQMLEVLIIGCADKVDAYIGQTVVKKDESRGCFVVGTGETFYKASISSSRVLTQDV